MALAQILEMVVNSIFFSLLKAPIKLYYFLGKTLGTLHEDKSLDTKKIVSKTDVISAMEAVEGAAIKDKGLRKRTPPSHEDMKKKALIRSLGRKPSEDKLALYVRKPSSENSEETSVKLRDKKSSSGDSKKSQFLQDMARRSLEVPTDFLDKIEEEKKSTLETGKKFPFHRTTTPNTLREHLKETLARNLGSSTDLAETIHAIRDDEILDTFNIDSENIETPPIQRRAFRHKSFKLPEQEEDNEAAMSIVQGSHHIICLHRPLWFSFTGSSMCTPCVYHVEEQCCQQHLLDFLIQGLK